MTNVAIFIVTTSLSTFKVWEQVFASLVQRVRHYGGELSEIWFRGVHLDLHCHLSMPVSGFLSTVQALGWALNRGPLVRPLNLVQFLFVYSCPITPREGVYPAACLCKAPTP